MSIQAYQNNSVETASPGELTLMLYNGCIKFIKVAGKAMENNEIEKKNTHIQKAQKIIQELMVTMDQQYSLTQEIMPLYDYMNRRLMEANTKNDNEILDEVLGLVEEFRNTWKQVILEARKAQYGQGGNA
ncbi:flagellar protein FliS [Halobacillus karajensis]|uniref:Flagellar secretion chaperone FliS n=1 Tax=Halobacillus karajensis TaxID=195088 RepID=A0A059NY18_9BACI|nr:flagellar export chaperone FliS [Halobacillus karajensis]CDQ19215.1 Flagellar protein FliS [Halobacillus karajensis]CDQ22711.1 Flagellar protein FliS [Halobacillus karajensis]CDQ26193.1 Flagellar protein FliS [Halobacillus karajensis]SEH39932.1 flagellar protein FliS [Halobacillus karajensis]